ncbi:MAG: FG-GAP repeat domain-containing protein, partial [Planctomycetaceae bacterium]
ASLDSRPGAEVISIDGRNGRISVLQAEPAKQAADSVSERLLRYGIGATESSRDRAVAVADFDGDKLADVLVNEPGQAQLLLYRQNGIDGLGTAEQYPALLGITDVVAEDLDGDGRLEAVLMSRFENGRLTFPEAILRKPEGWELATVAVLKHDGQPQLIVGLSQGSGNSAKLEYRRHRRDADGRWAQVADDAKLEFTGAVGQRGVRLVQMDVNGDGRQDLLSIASGQAKSGFHVLLQGESGQLTAAISSSQLDAGVAAAGRIFVNGSNLLVARDSFARMLTWKEGGWQVVDQFNAGEAAASIESVAALDLDGVEGNEVVLLDSGVRRARILRREDNVYRPWREVELGAAPFSSTLTADL